MTRTIRDLPLYEWTGNYSPLTGKIEGCRKGSRTWWHERRHQWQFDTLGKYFQGYQVIFSLAGIFASWALVMGDFYVLVYSVACMLPMSVLFLIAELDAEIYAWRKYFADVEIPHSPDNGSDRDD